MCVVVDWLVVCCGLCSGSSRRCVYDVEVSRSCSSSDYVELWCWVMKWLRLW